MKHKKLLAFVLSLVLVLSLTTACGGSRLQPLKKRAYKGRSQAKFVSADFEYMNGDLTKNLGVLEEGEQVALKFKSDLETGQLQFFIADRDNIPLSKLGEGDGLLRYTAQRKRPYKLIVRAKEARGSFECKWQLIPIDLLGEGAEIIVIEQEDYPEATAIETEIIHYTEVVTKIVPAK